MRLGQFARAPITSTGLILRGTWGNLPGGETFIAPLEGTANGSFVLNGAFTGHVLPMGAVIVLTFVDGVLTSIQGPDTHCARLDAVLGRSASDKAGIALCLAELGIGVNQGVLALTGNALFDEKKAGTIHIAIGDNSIYGGTLKASLHEDLIATHPTLHIDDSPILLQGRYVLSKRHWREDFLFALKLGHTLPETR